MCCCDLEVKEVQEVKEEKEEKEDGEFQEDGVADERKAHGEKR